MKMLLEILLKNFKTIHKHKNIFCQLKKKYVV